jgi:hypothetical protein
VSLAAAHFYCSQKSHAANANNEVLLNLLTLKNTIFFKNLSISVRNHAKNDLRLGGIKYVIVPEEEQAINKREQTVWKCVTIYI